MPLVVSIKEERDQQQRDEECEYRRHRLTFLQKKLSSSSTV